MSSTAARLCQWNTPAWAAQELVDRFFPELAPGDLVLEPSCGTGAFLRAIPEAVTAIGIEIDPRVAELAATRTGRRVIVGDFRTVHLDHQPTVIVGNPPYRVEVIEGFLGRARSLLPANGRCGFLLPAYAMQTHHRVVRWNESWSMASELIPRRLFPRLRLPLVFVLFTKDRARTMVGFALYRQAVEFDDLGAGAKLLLIDGVPLRATWRGLVEETLKALGGKASLPELYGAIAPRRITPNPWWQEKVRQVLQLHFAQVARGVWALPAP